LASPHRLSQREAQREKRFLHPSEFVIFPAIREATAGKQCLTVMRVRTDRGPVRQLAFIEIQRITQARRFAKADREVEVRISVVWSARDQLGSLERFQCGGESILCNQSDSKRDPILWIRGPDLGSLPGVSLRVLQAILSVSAIEKLQ
jgi:hypothetical protein